MSWLRFNRYLFVQSLGSGFTQMMLAVWKKLKSTLLNMPNSFCFNNFAQK